MTARQAAEHIMAGILACAEDKKADAVSMRLAGLHGDADIEETKMDTLLILALALSSAIEDGEYGE